MAAALLNSVCATPAAGRASDHHSQIILAARGSPYRLSRPVGSSVPCPGAPAPTNNSALCIARTVSLVAEEVGVVLDAGASASAPRNVVLVMDGIVSLYGLIISGGFLDGSNGNAGAGLAVLPGAVVDLHSCSVRGNTVSTTDAIAFGGGISNQGTIEGRHVHIHDNRASHRGQQPVSFALAAPIINLAASDT